MNAYEQLTNSILEQWHKAPDESTKAALLAALVEGVSYHEVADGPIVLQTVLLELIPTIFNCGWRIGWGEGREHILRMQAKAGQKITP